METLVTTPKDPSLPTPIIVEVHVIEFFSGRTFLH